MRILQFNTYDFGSTGYIMNVVSDACASNNIDCRNCFVYGKKKNFLKILKQKIISFITKLTGKYGFVNITNSRNLIRKIKSFQPDIVVLHNFHDNSVDCDTLFSYLAETKIKTVVVLHDCWAFTGYCPHFISIGCEKWKTECDDCPLRKKYSWFFDKSKFLFDCKKILFNKTNLTNVAISTWILNKCKQSFLSDKEIYLISNPVNLNDFRPSINKKTGNKKTVLGVAFDWSLNKGAEDFNFLAENLPDNYIVKVVGVDNKTKSKFSDKVQILPKTNSKQELSELYSSADVFVNASKEESFGLTNIEAQACGTPVVVYDAGGCSDTVSKKTGILVESNKKEDLLKAVVETVDNKKFKKDDCVAFAQKFDSRVIGQKYVKLFREIINENSNR